MVESSSRVRHAFFILALIASATAWAHDNPASGTDAKPEVVTLFGVKHFAKSDEKGELANAEAKVAAEPKNIENRLALGRAQSTAWRFHDAIATYTRALEIAPDDARLYRQRGHRYISIRRFDLAVNDLKRAAQLNDHAFDIWYHLGLAHYLRGEFAEAAAAYEKCYAIAERDRAAAAADKDGRDDSLIAVSDWLYMTYRRLDKTAEATRILDKITPESKVKENKSYFKRLLFYKGLKKEDELVKVEGLSEGEIATISYGLGNWHLVNGNRGKAEEIFRRIANGKSWNSFGFIAAEVDLARPMQR